MENDDIINEAPTSGNVNDSEKDYPEINSDILLVIRMLFVKLKENKKLFFILRTCFLVMITVLVIVTIAVLMLYIIPSLAEASPVKKTVVTNKMELKKNTSYKKTISLMNRDIQRMSRKCNAYTSGQSYIVINTTENRFFLYRNKKLVREGFCSSGSYTMLQTENDKKWIFKTPKGKYWIQGKTTNPVWKKPDWAFVEEGLPIPAKDDYSRYEYGVLGDYALAIGDGYLIHGTLYKRFLGMPVTHGCVRLNDEDLEVIFNTLSVGSKVYIF